MKIQTILVAIDFSDHSEQAFAVACELAKQWSATLHVVHAFEIITPLVTPYQVSIPDTYLTESRNVALRQLTDRVDKARTLGIAAEPHLTESPAAPAIARTAEEIGADLIVMGTRGMTGLKHFVLGSVAERTLRLAPCSVLTVKSAEA
jgi:nucleotide-binding universal stress UspA family protein